MLPMRGVRILEVAGIGPPQFAGMMLADMGADVIQVVRPATESATARATLLNRGRRSIAIDLKNPAAAEVVLRLVEGVQGLIEGFRPGVMERLGLGPDVCRKHNESLVYVRASGWGQDSPRQDPGHDINYLAMSGALHAIRRDGDKPLAPLNLVADFGGGGMLATVGLLAGLHNAQRTGEGTVVDSAMLDGCALLMTSIFQLRARGQWDAPPGANIIDSGAPFYEVYECADGGYVAVGAIEPLYYQALLDGLGVDGVRQEDQHNQSLWNATKSRFAATFLTKSRDQWVEVFARRAACVTPVLSMDESLLSDVAQERGLFAHDTFGHVQPSPAPRFDMQAPTLPDAPPSPGEHTPDVLRQCGFSHAEIDSLRRGGVVAWL